MKLLIERKAVLNFTDKRGFMPLHHAIWLRDVTSVEALLEAGANPNLDARADFPLHMAVVAGSKACLELLLRHKADPLKIDGNGVTARELAIQHQRTDFAELLEKAEAATRKK